MTAIGLGVGNTIKKWERRHPVVGYIVEASKLDEDGKSNDRQVSLRESAQRWHHIWVGLFIGTEAKARFLLLYLPANDRNRCLIFAMFADCQKPLFILSWPPTVQPIHKSFPHLVTIATGYRRGTVCYKKTIKMANKWEENSMTIVTKNATQIQTLSCV